VTVKELSGLSRRWQTYGARAAYVGLVAFIFWLGMSERSAMLSVSEFAQFGRDLFKRFFWPNLVLVTLASVSAGADMVAREVRSGALGLLVLTPLTSREIAYGKWRAAMAQTATLILCGAPVAAICLCLGGIGFWEVGWSFSLTFAMAALGSAFSLRYSAKYASAGKAFLMAIAAHVVFALLPPHPLYAAYMAYADSGTGSYGMNLGWLVATPLAFFITWRILRSAAKEIERRSSADLNPWGLTTDAQPKNPFGRVRFAGRGWQEIRRGVWEDRPLVWKELATRAAARLNPDAKHLFLIYALLFLATCFLISMGKGLGLFYFLWVLFMVLAVILGSSLFVYEKEGRKLEAVLCTPLPAWRIVRAKLVAGLVSPESVRMSILWALTVVGWSWWSGPAGILLCFAATTLFLLFAYVLSAAASLRARTVHGAFMAGAGAIFGVLVILPFLLRLLESPGAAPSLVQALGSALHPPWVLEPLEDSPGTSPLASALARSAERLLMYGTVYVAAIVGLVAYMIRDLRRLPERT
jgi:hypothetical protein